MKHKWTAAMLLALCLVLTLCACTGGEAAPSYATQPPEESPAASTMRTMELTELEQFYLNAFSSESSPKAVYEIKLAEEWSQLVVRIYRYENGAWMYYAHPMTCEIERDTCCLAVNKNLDAYDVAFYQGYGSEASWHSPGEGSSFDSYTADYSAQGSFEIDEEERAIVAYRRAPAEEEGDRPAYLGDFYEPEKIEPGEIEEYYMLTVQFIR